jgi:methyl-accepting chemotaxis protein
VAGEVRRLAERSQKAAAEIAELSVESVAVAESTGKVLAQMVPGSARASSLVDEIAASAREQNNGIDQVTRGIGQLEAVIQQNSSASEQLAASAETLSTEASSLSEAVSFFKVI